MVKLKGGVIAYFRWFSGYHGFLIEFSFSFNLISMPTTNWQHDKPTLNFLAQLVLAHDYHENDADDDDGADDDVVEPLVTAF